MYHYLLNIYNRLCLLWIYSFYVFFLNIFFCYLVMHKNNVIYTGLFQFVLSREGCADQSYTHDSKVLSHKICPLPKYFNHNATLHVLITFSSLLYFLAQVHQFNMRRKLKRNMSFSLTPSKAHKLQKSQNCISYV